VPFDVKRTRTFAQFVIDPDENVSVANDANDPVLQEFPAETATCVAPS